MSVDFYFFRLKLTIIALLNIFQNKLQSSMLHTFWFPLFHKRFFIDLNKIEMAVDGSFLDMLPCSVILNVLMDLI